MTSTEAPTWTLGDHLAKARDLAGLKVNQMADRLGVARNTVGNWENDRSLPPRSAVELYEQLSRVTWLLPLYDLEKQQSGWISDDLLGIEVLV